MTPGPDVLSGSVQWWDESGEYELRQNLHWRWDPIGVASVFPYAADEYDDYAPKLVDALRARGLPAAVGQVRAFASVAAGCDGSRWG